MYSSCYSVNYTFIQSIMLHKIFLRTTFCGYVHFNARTDNEAHGYPPTYFPAADGK